MRVLDNATKQAVQQVIDANLAQLKTLPGFVSAEPGFPIIDGAIHREAAILVFVTHKKPPTDLLPEERLPRQLGRYRVAVMQADPFRQVAALPGNEVVTESFELAASDLTYEPID